VPDITFPPVDVNKAAADFNHALKQGAYVAVGLGVLGFQRAQVQRVELMKQLEGQFDEPLDTARVQLTELARAVDERMQPVRQQLDEQIDRLEQTLPAAARNVVQSVRAVAAMPEQALRTAVGLD
jgi:recombinational DNA repair ATPase RecF